MSSADHHRGPGSDEDLSRRRSRSARAPRRLAQSPARRVPRHRRTLRLRQIHAVSHPRRARFAHRRPCHHRRRGLTLLTDSDRTNLRRRKVGFVFQKYNLLPTLTAIDNIRIAQHFGRNKEALSTAFTAAEGTRHPPPPAPQAARHVRRRAAACRHRPRARQQPRHPARRRAHRQPRHGKLRNCP
jgi:hypothetical protein